MVHPAGDRSGTMGRRHHSRSVRSRSGRSKLVERPAPVLRAGVTPRVVAPYEGKLVNRLWGRVSIRVASVGLLVAGVIGGVYIGKDREILQQSAQAQVAVPSNVDEVSLLKERRSEHAAARAEQRRVVTEAASEAAAGAQAAAGEARTIEKKAIAKEAAEKKAAEEAKRKAEEKAAASSGGSSGSGSVEFDGPIPASCEEFSGNRATGCALMIDAGFGIAQFSCLNKLWNKESGWNHRAQNPSSGAYGIPQSLPGSKMGSVASDWQSNPATQIKWGLGYIEGRYGSPCEAWSHSQSVGWY